MNNDSARRVLAELAKLNRLPYGPDMVVAWANALTDVDEADALAAVTALANDGVRNVGVPELRAWLRSQRQHGATGSSVEPSCGCTFTTFCEYHRTIGKTNARAILDSLPSEHRWSLPKRKPR